MPTVTTSPSAALGHVFTAYPERVASGASRVLQLLLVERFAGGADEWRSCPLTGDGFPVEVAFSSADDRLRLTVEPGPARLDPAHRLQLAARRVATAGGVPVPDEVLQSLLRLQSSDAPLSYGAWVSLRIGAENPDLVALKLYVESPDPTAVWPGAPAPRLPVGSWATRMVAYTPLTGEIEVYLRVPSLAPDHLATLLEPAGLTELAPRIRSALTLLYGYPLRDRVPGSSVGVSYTLGSPTTFTLHLFARSLWGGDRRIRERYAAATKALSGDPSTYLRVSAPLAFTTGWRTLHGIVGLSLASNRPPALTLGLRPPQPCARS